MSAGAHDEATMSAYSRAQQRLEIAGGYRWRDEVLAVLTGLGFTDDQARAAAPDLLRRRADARLARPGAGDEARSAAARRADQPPRHPLARVARGISDRHRLGGRPRRPRPLVPRGGRHLGARARGAPRPLLLRSLACVAQGAGGSRDRPRQGDRPAGGGARADGAVRRALPVQGDQGQAGAVAGQGRSSGSSATRSAATPATRRTCGSRSSSRSAPAGSC